MEGESMGKVYGYCRISRKEQSIERQVRNITTAYPDSIIVKEAFTGTKIEGRKGLETILKNVKKGDTIVFDSVSRMSRNAAEGVELYERLYQAGVRLVFLKEGHINTDTYDKALHAETVPMTGTSVDIILKAVNEYLKVLRREQIELAFAQAEKEVNDLHQRTIEGLVTARRNGKQIGQVQGRKLTVKKEAPAKEIIKKHSKCFGGTLTDSEVMKLANVSRNTFYKYKSELKAGE
jgi:DNA invertase Pin-like site-specific DNA recombinase